MPPSSLGVLAVIVRWVVMLRKYASESPLMQMGGFWRKMSVHWGSQFCHRLFLLLSHASVWY